MPALHINSTAGPRPIDAAALRQLLAQRSIAPDSRVLSLDAGRTWVAAQTALAVADQQAVDESTIRAAVAGTRPLHPIAMPLGVVGVVLLIAGISFGGGPAPQIIIETPRALAQDVQAVIGSGHTAVVATTDAARNLAIAGWTAWISIGGAPRAPEVPGTTATAPATATTEANPTAVAADEDLLSAWKAVIADQGREAAAWEAEVQNLGKRTISQGISRWQVRLVQCEKMSDGMAKEFPQAKQPLRLAIFEAPGVGDLPILTVVEDAAMAAQLDAVAADPKPVLLSAAVFKVEGDVARRSAVLMGYVRALE